jgi:hypothetical protein
MNRSEEDATRMVRSWLRDGRTDLSHQVRVGVLGALRATRQESPSWLRRQPAVVGGAARLATATAGLAALVLVGAVLLPGGGGIGTSRATASPQPPSLYAATLLPGERSLAPGKHLITEVAPIKLTITLSEGWIGATWGSKLDGVYDLGTKKWWVGNDRGRGAISFTTNVHSTCMDDTSLVRTSVSIDGYAGERIEFTSASQCHPNRLFDELGAPPGRGPDWLVTMWVLDIGGVDLVMIAATGPSDSTEQDVLRRVVESVQIDKD